MVNGVKLLVSQLDNVEAKMLRTMVDDLKNQWVRPSSCWQRRLMTKSARCRRDQDLTDRVKAGELIGNVAQQVGGKGGGRPDMAMAGTDINALPAALNSVEAGGLEAVNINK